jgi:hypothetical protein
MAFARGTHPEHSIRTNTRGFAIHAEASIMKLSLYARPVVAIPAFAFATLRPVGAQDRNPKKSRLAWAAKLLARTLYEPPNRLIWRLSEILAAHKGQASYHPDTAGGDNQ